MNKKKILLTIIILQGVLIVIGLIVVIYTIFFNIQNKNNFNHYLTDLLENEQVFLLDDEHIQIVNRDENGIYIEIFNIKNDKLVKTINLNEK